MTHNILSKSGVKEALFLEGPRAKETLSRHPLRPGTLLPAVKGKDHLPRFDEKAGKWGEWDNHGC